MKASIENGRLVIALPLQEPKLSRSGKALVVATSHGVRQSSLKVDGKVVRINVNAFVYSEGRPGIDQIEKEKERQTNSKANPKKKRRT